MFRRGTAYVTFFSWALATLFEISEKTKQKQNKKPTKNIASRPQRSYGI